jgi:hypothetical protein
MSAERAGVGGSTPNRNCCPMRLVSFSSVLFCGSAYADTTHANPPNRSYMRSVPQSRVTGDCESRADETFPGRWVLRCCSNSARESGMGLILLKDSASNPDVLIRTDYKPKKRNLTHIHSYVAHPQDSAKLTELAKEMNLILTQKTVPRCTTARASGGVERREPTRRRSGGNC